jgi:8-oxo-dGTP pyrophosphatase MutT (NUDIX family)
MSESPRPSLTRRRLASIVVRGARSSHQPAESRDHTGWGPFMTEPAGYVRQAAALPLRQGKVCIITSSNGKRWIIPKGLIDPGHTAGEAALQEAWEEAARQLSLRKARPAPSRHRLSAARHRGGQRLARAQPSAARMGEPGRGPGAHRGYRPRRRAAADLRQGRRLSGALNATRPLRPSCRAIPCCRRSSGSGRSGPTPACRRPGSSICH